MKVIFFLKSFFLSEFLIKSVNIGFSLTSHNDWIKTHDYASWAPLYDYIFLEALHYPFYLLKCSIYQELFSTGSSTYINQPETPISDIGFSLMRYDSDENDNQLDFPPALSTGPNWNHNVPLPNVGIGLCNLSHSFQID